MKKLYTNSEYAQACISANATGEKVYIKVYSEPEESELLASILIAPDDYYICYEDNYTDGTVNPSYEQEAAEKRRSELDSMTLTPADVERALYKAKGMDFDDLKALIATQLPQIDMKALSIEFRAKDFYRGAVAGGQRLFDVVGMLLGYTPDDMDYLFINKELPEKE